MRVGGQLRHGTYSMCRAIDFLYRLSAQNARFVANGGRLVKSTVITSQRGFRLCRIRQSLRAALGLLAISLTVSLGQDSSHPLSHRQTASVSKAKLASAR